MQNAIMETERRRKIQLEYNERHGIVPETTVRSRDDALSNIYDMEQAVADMIGEQKAEYNAVLGENDVEKDIERLEQEMKHAASMLEFERAASIRDRINELKASMVEG
jgi:excinuclease ABC subunit B